MLKKKFGNKNFMIFVNENTFLYPLFSVVKNVLKCQKQHLYVKCCNWGFLVMLAAIPIII